MHGTDDWGRDPAVRGMREVFGRMETGQRELLGRLGVSPREPRLRRWRDEARRAFERSWARAVRAGRGSAEDAAALYVRCLARVLADGGVAVPPEELPREEDRP